MSMGIPNEDQLRKNYRNFGDERILRIAHDSVSKLRPEAVEILREEIQRRGMNEALLEDIDAQLEPPPDEDVLKVCALVQALPCPSCQNRGRKLNATEILVVTSNFIKVRYEKRLYIACKDCLEKKHAEARHKNLRQGWWGIPLGIAKTIQALMHNSKQLAELQQHDATQVLRNFSIKYYGSIRSLAEKEEDLYQLVRDITWK